MGNKEETMNKLELQKMANEVRKGIVTGVHAAKAGSPPHKIILPETLFISRVFCSGSIPG